MLAYTKDNIPGTTVVSAWWDYGYWLTLLGNVTTLADNATVNATQIQNVGYTFMARENRSLQLLSTYNAEYALVFVTLQIQVTTDQNTGQQTAYVTYANFGDEGKWTWMARISGDAQNRFQDTISPYGEHYMDANMTWKDESAFGYFSNATSTQAAAWVWSDQGMNSTVYKMMSWAKQEYATKYGLQNDQSGVVAPTYFLDDTKGGYFAGMELDPNTAVQQFGGLVPLVCLYKIDWAKFNADMGITTATP